MNINLMNGDCLEKMKEIPDKSVDMVLTDPPYRVISGGKDRSTFAKNWKGSILEDNDGKIFKHNNILAHEWMPEIYRVLKDNSHVYIMVNFLNLPGFMKELQSSGFDLHNLLVWEKSNATPNRWYMKNCEYVIFARKGKAKPIHNMGSKTVHQFDNISKNKNHPTEKPVSLLEMYLANSTATGETILDPFMGSGSTGVACKNLNRNFIGIERDEKYFEIAKNRIEQA